MKPSPSAMARELDDEVVILHVPSGEYFSLNPVGALIWSHLEQGSDTSAIVEAITTEFDVDEDTAARDLDTLLTQLAAADLVEAE